MDTVVVPDNGGAVGRKLPLPITTPRLVLRRLQGNDWKDLLECLSDEELFSYTDGRPLEEEEIIRWLESDHHVRLTTPNQTFYLGITLQEGGKLIGYVSLSFTDPQRLQATLAVFMNRNFQRQGFALETVDAALGFCFEGIRLHRVTASCDSRNVAACGLFEKVGMRREGEFVKNRFSNGEWTNSIWFAALGEEYREAGVNPPPGSSA
jgi:RimJ/RimL family protein N-acetyltransferase